jgi:hypothetical protein
MNMKMFPSLAVLFALLVLEPGGNLLQGAEEDGVALAIIFDTSGSMKDPVTDKSGHASPKYVIADRALEAIAARIQNFATNTAGSARRRIEVGLFVFKGDGAREAVKFGPFDAIALHRFARGFTTPTGNTPLGNALNIASQPVLNSTLPHKHVLVVTDGMNTAGPSPSAVLPKLKQQAERNHANISFHFVAFDVDAKVFDSIKKQGATVVSAADESQLDSQLEFILQRKILLEEEERK